MKAFISGCAGTELATEEIAFFAAEQPWGLILFKRNCAGREQVRGLVGAFRAAVGRGDAPILIDQEGGRVQRIGPPHWPKYPPGAAYGRLPLRRGAGMARRLARRLIASDFAPSASTSIACRFSTCRSRARTTSSATAPTARTRPPSPSSAGRGREGLLAGGVLPVIKHIPGHGRAAADSHLALPVVETPREDLEARDFAPFRALADMPLAMTAHVVYSALDRERPATTSPVVIREIIRGASASTACC